MTAAQAIDRTDRLKPNSYAYADKLVWLSQLDGTIRREIIDTHEGGMTEEFVPYTEEGGGERTLLAEPPYDEMYIHYLASQIDYYNGEYDRFNNSNGMFEAVCSAFRSACNRAHPPKGTKKKYW